MSQQRKQKMQPHIKMLIVLVFISLIGVTINSMIYKEPDVVNILNSKSGYFIVELNPEYEVIEVLPGYYDVIVPEGETLDDINVKVTLSDGQRSEEMENSLYSYAYAVQYPKKNTVYRFVMKHEAERMQIHFFAEK